MVRLALNDVSLTRGSHTLGPLSLCVEPGERVGLIGPNGAGKSTLLALAAGLLTPDAGDVTLNNAPVRSLANRAAKLAYLDQQPTADPAWTVAELVATGRAPHLSGLGFLAQEDEAAVTRALFAAELTPFADRRLATLSGGERARAFLAALLAQETPLLLADEPAASLDPCQALRCLELIARRGQPAAASLLAVHDLNLAARFATRLVLLNQGCILAEGAPAEVLRKEHLDAAYGPGLSVLTHAGRPLVVHGISEGAEPAC